MKFVGHKQMVQVSIIPDTHHANEFVSVFSQVISVAGFNVTIDRLLRHRIYQGFVDFRSVIVGNKTEAGRVSELLRKTDIKPDIIGLVSPGEKVSEPFFGSIDQIADIVRINKVDEIVFCSKDIPSENIIGIMTRLIGISVDYKIAPPESLSIIGSNSINTAGDLYTIHFNSIGKESNLRNKRLFDFISAFSIVITFPIWLVIIKKPLNGFKNTDFFELIL